MGAAARQECPEGQGRALDEEGLAEPYPPSRRTKSSAVGAPEVGEHDALESGGRRKWGCELSVTGQVLRHCDGISVAGAEVDGARLPFSVDVGGGRHDKRR